MLYSRVYKYNEKLAFYSFLCHWIKTVVADHTRALLIMSQIILIMIIARWKIREWFKSHLNDVLLITKRAFLLKETVQDISIFLFLSFAMKSLVDCEITKIDLCRKNFCKSTKPLLSFLMRSKKWNRMQKSVL